MHFRESCKFTLLKSLICLPYSRNIVNRRQPQVRDTREYLPVNIKTSNNVANHAYKAIEKCTGNVQMKLLEYFVIAYTQKLPVCIVRCIRKYFTKIWQNTAQKCSQTRSILKHLYYKQSYKMRAIKASV